jgi:CheY-like chemotaxis protein
MENVSFAESLAAPALAAPVAPTASSTVSTDSLVSNAFAAAGDEHVSFSLPSAALPPRLPALTFDPALPPILIAEDDEDDAYFIQRLIKKTGAPNPLRRFDDGSEVVNFLGGVRRAAAQEKHRPPLLLFLDLNMRGLGGFGFLEWARAQQKLLSPLTIVILSNSDCPQDMARARELGAHRYLVKYPSVATFASIVRSVYPAKVF